MSRNSEPQSVLPIVLMVAGALILVGVLIWFFMSSAPAPVPTSAPAADRIPYPDVSRVGLGDAKAAFDTETAVFVDVRGEALYSESHIPGAISMTEEELDARLKELNPNDWIIPYCT
jgi:hypothetical protein